LNASSAAVTTLPAQTSRSGVRVSIGEGKPRGSWEAPVVIGGSLILAVRLFVLVSRNAVNIFFNDQWDFYDATLFQKHPLWEIFRWQYGPPRLGLGPLVSKLLEPYFRWNSRGEAFLATAIVTVAAVAALYLKTRAWGRLRWPDLAIPLIFFTPAQFESLWITPNLAHGLLPLLLIVLYCLALTCEFPATRYTLVLLLNFAAIYTGFGLFIGFITPLWLLLDYYSRREARQSVNWLVVLLAISLASLGSFFAGYRLDPDAQCFSLQPHGVAHYLNFAVLMLAHFFGARSSRPVAWVLLGGGVLVAMLFIVGSFGWLFWERKSYLTRDLIPAVLTGYGLIFCAGTAYGRACFGPYVAFSSRYTEYVELGMLGVYLYALDFRASGLRQSWARKLVPGIFLMFLLMGAGPVQRDDRSDMRYYHSRKENWRKCYLNTEDLQGCDKEAGFAVYPVAARTGLKEKLEYLKRERLNLYSDAPSF
jgi:uncharacterized membrane protein